MQSKNELVAMMNQNEVAALLKVSPKTMEYWRCRGGGPRFIKLGKHARYLESDLVEFVKGLLDEIPKIAPTG
jgi:hypothetical protein